MKDKIDRSDFKYNFLKKVIIRIDYNGILDLDMDYTVRNIKDELYDQGFKIFREGFINQVDFEIKDPELIETQMMIPVNELKKGKIIRFFLGRYELEYTNNKILYYIKYRLR
jgi:hypothetical protein